MTIDLDDILIQELLFILVDYREYVVRAMVDEIVRDEQKENAPGGDERDEKIEDANLDYFQGLQAHERDATHILAIIKAQAKKNNLPTIW